MTRVPALDGLRGVAIALVVGEHARLLPGGNLGVVVFFVLSGYLITGLLTREHDRTGTVRLREFYRRRVIRLYPALTVALTGLAVGSLLVGAAAPEVLGWVLLSLLYLVNLAISAIGWELLRPIDFIWTLSLEEQFYLLWPLALIASLRQHTQFQIARVLLLTAAAVTSARIGWVLLGGDPWQGYYAPWFRADALLIGCALALLPGLSLTRLIPWAWAALTISALFGAPGAHPVFALAVAIPATIATTVVLISTQPSVLTWQPLRYLGRISYALYLWNGVICAVWLQHTGVYPTGWVVAPVGIGLSVALAVASTHLLEEPLRARLSARHRVIELVRG